MLTKPVWRIRLCWGATGAPRRANGGRAERTRSVLPFHTSRPLFPESEKPKRTTRETMTLNPSQTQPVTHSNRPHSVHFRLKTDNP